MKYPVFYVLIFTFFLNIPTVIADHYAQADTVRAVEVSTSPVVDGDPKDACWEMMEWQTIDQVWIEYGTTIDSSDFSGRYKVVWSEPANLLYFLVEIVDDIIVDGYVYNSNPQTGGGYPHYDIVEVFIDQDKSGGLHVFDGTGNTGAQWGTNAENAFSYHIAADIPAEGDVTLEKVVCDIAGTDWGNYYIPNFDAHLPDFALAFIDDRYYWEFSLAVYDDSYAAESPEDARVELKIGDIMGLSLAYCDNDDPDEEPKQRDHFFGSVWVPEANYNDHWMNADFFGTLQLVSEATLISESSDNQASYLLLYPNPSSGLLNLKMSARQSRNGLILIYNILGQKVLEMRYREMQEGFQQELNLNNLPPGVYFLHARLDNKVIVKKFMLIGK